MKELIEKYNQGLASETETSKLEELIAAGKVELSALKTESELFEKVMRLELATPSPDMDDKFYRLLSGEKRKTEGKGSRFSLQHLWSNSMVFKLAYTLLILVVGFGLGSLLNKGQEAEINDLTTEVTEMKELMMLSLLEKESTSDRLKAVHLTSNLPRVSDKVTDALIRTLNNDENVNVRLASLEALYPYSGNSNVRMALISSIRNQDSPLVQIALAEMMVTLQEKKSIEEFQYLLEQEETPAEIKDRLEESIQTLI